MKKITQTKVFQTIFRMVLGSLFIVSLNACSQEESENLGNAPIYQHYAFMVNPQGEAIAYANFSTSPKNSFQFIKLNKEQGILSNGIPMNYNRLDEIHSAEYAYSLQLKPHTEKVSFKFRRNKTVILENILDKKDIAPIALPDDLTTIEIGKPVMWKGIPVQPEDEIEIFVELADSPDYYYQITGSVTSEGKGFVFDEKPLVMGKHKYKLTLRRTRKQPTKQNDNPATGDMTLCYFDTKMIEIE